MIKKIISATKFTDGPPATICTPGFNPGKTASSTNDELQAFLRTMERKPKHHYMLVNALGAGETYGPNSNYDYMPEKELLSTEPDTGYKTFETHGNVFQGHVNKDPEKRIGRVMKSIFNPAMHRVELLICLPEAGNERILAQAEGGNDVGFSMGVKIKGDSDSWCGNFAATKKDYCDHIKYQLGHVREDGTVCMMINHKLCFFDISVVSVPADKISWMLEKVASGDDAGSLWSREVFMASLPVVSQWKLESAMAKTAGLPDSVAMADILDDITAAPPAPEPITNKVADIDKIVGDSHSMGEPGLGDIMSRFRKENLGALRRGEAEIPSIILDEAVDSFGGDVGSLLATLAAYGVVLKPREYQRLILRHVGEGDLRNKLDESDSTFEEMEPKHYPEDNLDLAAGKVDHDLAGSIADIVAKKSYHRGGLIERVLLHDEGKVGPEDAEELVPLDDETKGRHGQLLSRVGGGFQDYSRKALDFAREVARAAAHHFPDTDLTVRLGIAPSMGGDCACGLPAIAMGASTKQAMAGYPDGLRLADTEQIAGLKTAAAKFAANGQVLRAPAAVADALILEKLGLL